MMDSIISPDTQVSEDQPSTKTSEVKRMPPAKKDLPALQMSENAL
ncbi:MAG: hypothetical protein ACLGPL_08020, partial [Acidobacteriota bacterium]